MPSGRQFKEDLIGRRFTRLVVIGKQWMGKNHRWLCRCDCGKEVLLLTCHLTSSNGKSNKSCGCYNRERAQGKILDSPPSATKTPGHAAKHALYNSYRKAAKTRNHVWQFDFEQLVYITSQNCYYCGVEPKQISSTYNGRKTYTYNGIDRMDNTQGYTLENCVTCCKVCNRAKNSMPYDLFIEWLDNLVKYRNSF